MGSASHKLYLHDSAEQPDFSDPIFRGLEMENVALRWEGSILYVSFTKGSVLDFRNVYATSLPGGNNRRTAEIRLEPHCSGRCGE